MLESTVHIQKTLIGHIIIMLSFIFRLVRVFENEHGFSPNVVYLNRGHLRALAGELSASGRTDGDGLSELLGIEIMLRTEAVHPHVGWLQAASRQAV